MRAVVSSSLCLLALIACTGATEPAGPASSGSGAPASAVLDLVVPLVGTHPYRATAVGTQLGVNLSVAGSNGYFTMYEGGPVGPFSEVEVREPNPAAPPGQGGMVLLTVSEGCVRREDVGDRFGPRSDEVFVRSHHEPPTTPEYDRYPQTWGLVSLGYDPTTGCLVDIVLNATRVEPAL